MTVYTAIIGNYDELKEPFVITPGWNYVCFTDQDLQSNTWEIRKVDILPFGRAKTARHIKILPHLYLADPETLWIDGTFFINCDLNEWWRHFRNPFTTVKHPFDRCIYTDIWSCLASGKGDPHVLRQQRKAYQEAGIPTENGLISSGILMRKDCDSVRRFCELWWSQVEKYTERDQIAFGYANHLLPNSHYGMSWNYTSQHPNREFIHHPHKHKRWSSQLYEERLKKYGSNKTS